MFDTILEEASGRQRGIIGVPYYYWNSGLTTGIRYTAKIDHKSFSSFIIREGMVIAGCYKWKSSCSSGVGALRSKGDRLGTCLYVFLTSALNAG